MYALPEASVGDTEQNGHIDGMGLDSQVIRRNSTRNGKHA
jgi:hypothetical protein